MADTKEIISCPACQADMEKVFIERVNFYLDICKNCGGIFFDNREFKYFDEKHEDVGEIAQVLKDAEIKKNDTNELRICPYCHTNMVKTGVNPIIDECYTCGAKFLDGSELEQYRNQFENDSERTASFVNILNAAIENKLKF